MAEFQMQNCGWSSNQAAAAAYGLHHQNQSCMAPQNNMPNFMNIHHHGMGMATQGMHAMQQTQQVSPSVGYHMNHTLAHTPIEGFHDTDRRSSSIAALRLKAREHSAAMGILSVYGKWLEM